MVEITKQQAMHLIGSGAAGYWAINANPPIEHEKQTVVAIRGKFFLCSAREFLVEYIGPVGILGGKMKGAHKITCNDDLELTKWIKEDIQAYKVKI